MYLFSLLFELLLQICKSIQYVKKKYFIKHNNKVNCQQEYLELKLKISKNLYLKCRFFIIFLSASDFSLSYHTHYLILCTWRLTLLKYKAAQLLISMESNPSKRRNKLIIVLSYI